MHSNPSQASADCAKLRHDLRNDIGSLKMNLEALRLMRDDANEHAELIELMQGTIKMMQERLEFALKLIADADESMSSS